MSDYRSEAEKFVTAFLDYVYEYDILDQLNKRTQKMERSPGVQSLVKMAESVFPARIKKGEPTPEIAPEDADAAIKASPNVIDTREMFSRRVQESGGVRSMLRSLYYDEPGAADKVREFLEAEDGTKEFAKE